MDIDLLVPSRVAALLPESNGFHFINCAFILDLKDGDQRARRWKRGISKRPSLQEYLQAAIIEGCDTPIRIYMQPEQWHLTGYVCGKLGITPGHWLLACAAYNAQFEEQRIEAKLSGIPAMLDE